MKINRSANVLLCALLILLLPGMICAQTNIVLSQQLKKTIEKLRSSNRYESAEPLAEHLVELTKEIDPITVDDETVKEMVSLLDIPYGFYDVIDALGNLGPRAKIAIPRLLELLPVEECAHVDHSAAPEIQQILLGMGAKIPDPPSDKQCASINTNVLRQQLPEIAAKIRTGDKNTRENAMQNLEFLTAYADPNEIDDATVNTIASLWDTTNEDRFMIIISLRHLGPHAKILVPEFEALVSKANCGQDSLSAEDRGEILDFLYEMGAKIPSQCRFHPQ